MSHCGQFVTVLITISVQICSDTSVHTAMSLHVTDYIFVSLMMILVDLSSRGKKGKGEWQFAS